MRLHTNTLTHDQITTALNSQKRAGSIDTLVGFESLSTHRSRSHKSGFEIQLGWYGTKVKGDGRRFKNSGNDGASNVYAATYDEWGFFIAEIMEMDPEAVFGPYNGVQDFNSRTRYQYDPASELISA